MEFKNTKKVIWRGSPTWRIRVGRASHNLKKITRFLGGRFVPLSKCPVMVLGNQKSGTTSIAALLAAYGGLSSTLDIRDLSAGMVVRVHAGQLPFQLFLEIYRRDFSRQLIKEPHLTPLFPQISQHFPQGRFLMVIRDPRDNIRSILNRLNLPGDNYDLSSEQMRGVNGSWGLVLDGRRIGIEGETYIDLLARRWLTCAQIYEGNKDRIHLLRYEDFVSDKEQAIQSTARVLAIDGLQDISDLLDVQFQPPGNKDVDWMQFFREGNLNRIEMMCGDAMVRLGYPTGISRSPTETFDA